MAKDESTSKGKAGLRLEAKKSLANQLKPLIKAFKENGLEESSTKDMGVHALIEIIKLYQNYFKVLHTIETFDSGNGRPRDLQKRGIMLDIYIKLWAESPDKLPPKQSVFREAIQNFLLKERVINESGEYISISEDACFDFLREIKAITTSSLPKIMELKILNV